MNRPTLGPLLGYSIGAAVLLRLACGLASGAATPADPQDPSRPPLQTLMKTRIDPAADALWDAVASLTAGRGEEDRLPPTPAQWMQLRQSAQALLDAAAELTSPGQWVARTGQPSAGLAGDPGAIDAPDIQRRIDADPAAFLRRARALGSAAQKALAAIDVRDADGLMDAGGRIDAACESCHVLYWYPRQLPQDRY